MSHCLEVCHAAKTLLGGGGMKLPTGHQHKAPRWTFAGQAVISVAPLQGSATLLGTCKWLCNLHMREQAATPTSHVQLLLCLLQATQLLGTAGQPRHYLSKYTTCVNGF